MRLRRASLVATAALVLGSLGAPALAVDPGEVPSDGAASVDRIAGETRYDTAAQTALRAYPDGADTVLVATGENFPDALAAAYFSGLRDAPVLLVEQDAIPTETSDALETLAPGRAVVLGGQAAVSKDVVGELDEMVDNVNVVAGDTRTDTAARIAIRGGQVGTAPNLSDPEGEDLATVIVAREDSFPDALAAGPLALAGTHPILLTDSDELSRETLDVLRNDDLEIQQVILAGGPVAISAEVEQRINNIGSIESVARVQGENRTATAVALGALTRTAMGWDASTIGLARGDNFPDALTMAPLAAQQQASLFLSRDPQTIDGDTFAGIQSLCGAVEDMLVAGGTVALSEDAVGEATLATVCADHAFPIEADQEVPEEGQEGAAGIGWVVTDGSTICTAYDVEGLDQQANASHIHEAPAGEAGDVVLDLGVPSSSGFLATCATGEGALASDIRDDASQYYVNVHTPGFALGAARGQLDGTQDLRVALTGEAEVEEDGDPADEPAAGEGSLDLFVGEAGLCYELSVSGLESPVDPSVGGGFHIHEGASDENGPVVVPLPQAAQATDYSAFGCVPVAADLLQSIQDSPEDFYANLHTVEGGDPDTPLRGALRGQLG